MKILHTLYQCKTGAGALRVALDLAAAARAEGHQVTILARDAAVFAAAGAERFFTGNKIWDWWRLRHRLQAEAWDLVHLHDRYCSLLLRLMPTAPPSLQTNHMLYQTHRRLTLFANVVVGCSQAMDRHHAEFFGLPAWRRACIPNGVTPPVAALPQLPFLRRSLPDPVGHRFLCLTVARLSEQKGHRYLLEAIARLPLGLRKSWAFVWAGDGDLELALRAQAEQLGILEDVVFLGHTAHIPEWLALANAFVLPSLYEGLPLSLLEAMAAGLPCLATAVDGTCEVIRHQDNGLLSAPADPDSLQAQLQMLLSDADLRQRLGAQAQQDYQAHWSFDRTWQQYAALYRQLSHSRSHEVKAYAHSAS
jgi:glycosyltransferase involved in cell wall biosynthesis